MYEDNYTRRNITYYSSRLLIVVIVLVISIIIPNINIMLTIGGSVIGTVVTVIIPVVFYSRAYSGEIRHLKKDLNSSRM